MVVGGRRQRSTGWSPAECKGQETHDLKPVIWRDGLRVPLSVADGVAHHVNNAGMVLGQLRPSGGADAFLWQDGVLTDPCPTLAQCTGMHLNEAGQTLVRAGSRSYVFEGGTLTDLGVFGPGVGTFAHTLIDNGAVVGIQLAPTVRTPTRGRSCISDGTLNDLNDLLPPGSGWTRLDRRHRRQ